MISEFSPGEEPAFCGNCGVAAPAGRRVCAVCGQPLAIHDAPTGPPPPDYIPYCRSCGVGVSWGMGQTCRRCGVTPLCQLHFQPESGFCPDCTASTAAGMTVGGLRCAACGANVSPNSDFCFNCGQAVTVAPYAGVEYMGFWIRFAAFMVDLFIVYLIAIAIAVVIGFSRTSGEVDPQIQQDIDASLATINYSFFLLHWGLWVVYSVLLTGWRGQTLGKMLLRIQVVDANGNIPSWYRVVLRDLVGKTISLAAVWLGYIWVGFDPNKRGWHDYMGGSYVVRKRRNAGHT